MGFFPELDPPAPSKTIAADAAWSHTLANAVRKSTPRCSPISIAKWSVQFALLRNTDGIPQGQIGEVLDWYVDHIGEHRIPMALSAKAFRAKFPYIELAKKIWDQRNPSVQISQTAREIADRLGRRYWPKGSKGQLPVVCQQSLDNYKAFAQRVRKRPESRNGSAVEAFFRHIRAKLTDPAGFVENWFNAVHGSIARWEHWSGDLFSYVFRPEHKLFQRMGRDWAQKYCARPYVWDNLMEELS